MWHAGYHTENGILKREIKKLEANANLHRLERVQDERNLTDVKADLCALQLSGAMQLNPAVCCCSNSRGSCKEQVDAANLALDTVELSHKATCKRYDKTVKMLREQVAELQAKKP